jgi:hypothetical protein
VVVRHHRVHIGTSRGRGIPLIAVEITVKQMARGEGDQPVLLAAGGVTETGTRIDQSDACQKGLDKAYDIVMAALEARKDKE